MKPTIFNLIKYYCCVIYNFLPLFPIEANNLKIKAEWTGTEQNDVNVTWTVKTSNNNNILYKVYYIEMPYKNYWKEVQSTDDLHTTHIKFSGLRPDKKYRFTVICLKKYGKYPNDLIIDCKSSSVYLVPKVKAPLQYQQVIPAPANLRCATVSEQEVKLSWDALHSSNDIWGYKVTLMNELDNDIDTFETSKTHLDLTNLDKGTWYGARLEAYGLSNRYYSKTKYTICRTKTNGKLNHYNNNVTFVNKLFFNNCVKQLIIIIIYEYLSTIALSMNYFH